MPRPRLVSDDAVLDAASRVVARAGPAGATLAAVGAECGLSAATLVQRFGSKRRLLLALSSRSVAAVTEGFADARARHDDPVTALLEALAAQVAGLATPEAMANSLAFLHLDLVDDEFRAVALDVWRAMRTEIAATLGTGDDVARRVLVAYNGSLITWAVERDGPLADRLRADVLAVL